MPKHRQTRSARLAGCLVLLGAMATAMGCNAVTFQPTPRPSRVIATAQPTEAPTPVETDEAPTLRPDPSGDAVGLVDAADALADLASYRVAVTSRGLVPATTSTGRVTMTSTLIQGDSP